MSTHAPATAKTELPLDARIGIVAARFNQHIVDAMIDDCVQQLHDHGIDESRIEIYRVPGAYELPVAARWMGETKRFRAIICLGCVIRGDTPHFEYVAGETARGIMQTSLELALPIIFGVLTTNTEQQATDRTNGKHSHAGKNAADAAIEMIALARSIKSR